MGPPDAEVVDYYLHHDALNHDGSYSPHRRPTSDEIMRELSTPHYTGRKSGTPGGTAAALYIAGLLASCGLEPMGDTANSYLHAFNVTPIVHDGPMTMSVTPSAGGAKIPFSYRKHWRPGRLTPKADLSAPLIFLGYGLNETKHDDYKGMAVDGAVLVALRGCPPSITDEKVCNDIAKLDKAKANQAKAFILLADDGSVNIWGGGQGDNLYVLPVVVMKRGPAEAFMPPGSTLASVQTKLDTQGPQSFKTGLTLKLLMSRKVVKDALAYNVVARLRSGPVGTKSHIVSGAHYDHLGFDMPPFMYFPGSLDNASGTAVVIDAACRLAADPKLKLKRDLVFALWAAEEDGLIGSRTWLEAAKLKPAEIAYSFNLDMVGGTGPGPVFVDISQPDRTTLEPPLKKLAADLKLLVQIDTINSGNSDHANFVQRKISTVYLRGPYPAPLHYHTAADVPAQMSASKLDELGVFLATSIKAFADR